VSAESRRAKQIGNIMDRSQNRYDQAFLKIQGGYVELFDEHLHALGAYVERRLTHYFNDLEGQLAKLEKPKNPSEIELYKETLTKIDSFTSKLIDFDAELRSFHFLR
jgi:hypothetical protein